MNDKEYEALKTKARHIVEVWRTTLGLGSFRLQFEWDRSYCSGNAKVCAEMSCAWQYKDAVMTVYLPRLAEMDDDQAEEVLVHELVHILLHPVAGDLGDKTDAEIEKVEFTTTSITQALLWTRRAGANAASRRAPRAGRIATAHRSKCNP